MKKKDAVIWLLVCVACGYADVRLPAVFSDGMVLQQNDQVAVWGWADPGEQVAVKGSWQAEGVSTVAGDNGRWSLKIATPSAGSKPCTLAVAGKNKIELNNVLLGEVWLCSGQSNMEFTLGNVNQWQPGIYDFEKEVAAANYPEIHLFSIGRNPKGEPQEDCDSSWQVCTSDTAAAFSAVGYFFGRDLYQHLKVPIGLILSAHGGTPCEGWMKMETMRSDEVFKPILERYDAACKKYPAALKNWETRVKAWEQKVADALKAGEKPPPKPWSPMGPGNFQAPSSLYNGMIVPILPYTLRGVIWYQGEANAARGYQYRELFPALINSWRAEWNRPDMPFYYVQIAPWNYPDPGAGAELRESQRLTLSVPHTGMAVITDVGEPDNIHPRNKQPVGHRLALWALADTYNLPGIVRSGPLYKSMKIDGGKIELSFDYVGGGLVCRGDRLTDFEIAGADGKFVAASAGISGDTVVVQSPEIKEPVFVRFGWANAPQPNLFNKEGLPASPFRTDNLPLLTKGRKLK